MKQKWCKIYNSQLFPFLEWFWAGITCAEESDLHVRKVRGLPLERYLLVNDTEWITEARA